MGLMHHLYISSLLYGIGLIGLDGPTSPFFSPVSASEHIPKFTKAIFDPYENDPKRNLGVAQQQLNGDGFSNPNILVVKKAIELIKSFGADTSSVCHPTSNEYDPYIPLCVTNESKMEIHHTILRHLENVEAPSLLANTNDEEEERKGGYSLYVNLLMALVCVTMAALAAGLTMGLLSLDPLELHIKKKASSSFDERKQSRLILPVIKDHHRLLVTLLLLNSIANEALPLFLDNLVPGYVAIIISVTLVLFFGEIIPSAVFTGPNKLAMAAYMIPMVKCFIFLMTPIAYPIAKLLDKVLGHDSDSGKYDKNELSALVRILYEERLAEKKRRKRLQKTMKLQRQVSSFGTDLTLEEVNIVQGALEMGKQTIGGICKKWEDVDYIDKDEVLDEETIEKVYSSGHSRLPVYDKSANITGDFDNTKSVCGMLLVRDLIQQKDRIKISEMNLYKPECIGVDMSLAKGLEILQKGAHLAMVCKNPEIAEKSLSNDIPLPPEAGLLGIVTLEDVIENIIKQNIWDETDDIFDDSKTHQFQSEMFQSYGSTVRDIV